MPPRTLLHLSVSLYHKSNQRLSPLVPLERQPGQHFRSLGHTLTFLSWKSSGFSRHPLMPFLPWRGWRRGQQEGSTDLGTPVSIITPPVQAPLSSPLAQSRAGRYLGIACHLKIHPRALRGLSESGQGTAGGTTNARERKGSSAHPQRPSAWSSGI